MHHEFSAFASREGQLSSCTACLILWTPLFKGMLLPFSSHLNLQCLPARSFPSVWRHFISSNHKTPSFDLSAHSTSALFLSSHRRKTPWKLSSHSTYLFSPGHATISIHPLHFCESPQVSVLSYFPQEHLPPFITHTFWNTFFTRLAGRAILLPSWELSFVSHCHFHRKLVCSRASVLGALFSTTHFLGYLIQSCGFR